MKNQRHYLLSMKAHLRRFVALVLMQANPISCHLYSWDYSSLTYRQMDSMMVGFGLECQLYLVLVTVRLHSLLLKDLLIKFQHQKQLDPNFLIPRCHKRHRQLAMLRKLQLRPILQLQLPTQLLLPLLLPPLPKPKPPRPLPQFPVRRPQL